MIIIIVVIFVYFIIIIRNSIMTGKTLKIITIVIVNFIIIANSQNPTTGEEMPEIMFGYKASRAY